MILKKLSLSERIFIAGANGMVGSAICRAFEKLGYVNSHKNATLLIPSREELNLLNSNAVEKWFKENKPTVVINAAAKVGGILANTSQPVNFLLDNLKIQNNIIENSWKNNVKRFLFLGSSCIYPKFANQPINEESLLTSNLEPTNQWYAISKICGIKLCEAFRNQYGFDAISLMPTNLYGPNDNYHSMHSHVMAALIRKFCDAKRDNLPYVTCWGSGKPLREFMHVDDLGTAVIFVLEHWFPELDNSPKDVDGNKLYYLNIGTGKDISIFELAKLISEIINYQGRIIWDKSKPDGTPKKLLSIDRITEMGWYPKISLKDGIRKTINDYELHNSILNK